MDVYTTVQGNLVADPEARSTADGATVVRLRIAASGRRFDRATGGFVDTDPMFISVSCWRSLAVNAMSTLRKGDSVIVYGRLTYRSYDDRQGMRRSIHQIDATALGPDLIRCPADLRRPTRPAMAGEGSDTSAEQRSSHVDEQRHDAARQTEPAVAAEEAA